jgi:very-short-patch-repair endonuclease/rubredoxin
MQHTYDEIKVGIEQVGYKLLSTEYRNNYTKLDIECDSSHRYRVAWTNFQQGYRCPYCSKKRVDFADIKSVFEDRGCVLLSEYKNSTTKLSIQCPQGHQYTTCWSVFRQGCECPHCIDNIGTYNGVKDFVENQGYILLSNVYLNSKTKLLIQCPKQHQYQVKWNDFQQGYRCPYCYGNHKRSTEEVGQYVQEQKYKLLSEYKNALSKIILQCPQEHQFLMSWNSFQQGQRCPQCNEYKGEKKLGEILEQIFPSQVQRQDNLEFLRLQKVDFSVRDLKLAFEYDGEQHFRPVRYGGMSFKKAKQAFIEQQKRDNRKNQLCQENGYSLIRIAYNEDLNLEGVNAKLQCIKAFV